MKYRSGALSRQRRVITAQMKYLRRAARNTKRGRRNDSRREESSSLKKGSMLDSIVCEAIFTEWRNGIEDGKAMGYTRGERTGKNIPHNANKNIYVVC